MFDASSGPSGNGNHDGNGGTIGSRTVPAQPQGTSTFNLGIKPKEPPVFYGRANEDVATWVAKLSDFFYLIEATPRQQVAYAATLLQEAAADWWVALLRERYGLRPEDFQEFAVLLEKRLGVQPGWIEPGPHYVTSGKGKQKLYDHIPPGSRLYWASSLRSTRTGQKPNLFGVCTRVWPNWSQSQGQRICIWQFARRKKSRWPGPLPQEDKQDRRCQIRIEGEAGANKYVGNLMQRKQ